MVLYIGAFAIIVAFVAIAWVIFGDKLDEKFVYNLDSVGRGPTNMRDVALQQAVGDRVFAPVVRGFGDRIRRFTPTGFVKEAETRILHAGMQSTWSVERFLGMKATLGIIGILYALYTFSQGFSIGLFSIVKIIGIPFGLFTLPDIMMDRKKKERMNMIQRELPDLLDQMTIIVEAGLGFEAAMDRIVSENSGPLSSELQRMLQDRRLGMPRQEAMDRLLMRTDLADLRHFILAIGQAEKLGMPLANTLRIQAGELRQKRRVRAEEKAMALPIKLVMPLTMCILPALLIVILGPAVMRLRENDFL